MTHSTVPRADAHEHPLGPTSRTSRKPGLVAAEVDGDTVVYDPGADRLHHLEPTASRVWSRLDGATSLAALAAEFAEEYGAGEARVRHDVLNLATCLWDQGLLVGSDAAQVRSDRPVGVTVEPQQDREIATGGWALPEAPYRTFRCRGLEYTFEVATNDAALRDYLEDVLAGLADPGAGVASRHELLDLAARSTARNSGTERTHPVAEDGTADTASGLPPARYLLRYDGEPFLATELLDWALAVLQWHINAEVVRRSTPRFPLVHAAAAVSGGVAVLLPAPPESGKTTTVAGLIRAGFDYLTDEAVAIDPDTLLALPYPKALSIDGGSWEVLADLRPPHAGRISGQWQVPPHLVRPDAVAKPAPVGFVVTPAYRAGAATRLERISRADTLMVLADSTFNFQDDPQRNLAVLQRLVAGADCFRLTVGDLESAVRLIDELVRSEELDITE